jgi:hypothetical protein
MKSYIYVHDRCVKAFPRLERMAVRGGAGAVVNCNGFAGKIIKGEKRGGAGEGI